MRVKIIILFYLLTNLIKSQTTCSLTTSSNWTVASSWSCGRVPLSTDNIYIPYGYTVTITTAINLSGGNLTSMVIDGVLFFDGNASRLDLPVTATVNLTANGRVTTNVNNNSQKFYIGNNPIWTSNNGSISGPSIGTSTSGQLPIELIYFYGVPNEFDVDLFWCTLSEKNNNRFDVLKSDDALTWYTMTTIIVNGSSYDIKTYNIKDTNPNIPIGYYKLKQVDFDGSENISRTITVDFTYKKKKEFIIKPNPNHGNIINIEFNGFKGDYLNITFSDLHGIIKYNHNVSITNEREDIVIHNYLPLGVYTVVIYTKKELYVKKIIIE